MPGSVQRKAGLFFYFNGFNSAILDDWSGSRKIAAVADYAYNADFDFLPVSINFREAPAHSRDIMDRIDGDVRRVVFCGSSMGGWFARIMQLMLSRSSPRLRCEAVAFNPAFDMSRNGRTLIGPQMNFVTLEEYEWTARHSDQLAQLENSVDYEAQAPFYVYVDKGDEVIAWRQSARRHRAISRFRAFEGGCHSFDHYREALTDFGAAAGQ